MCVIIKHRTILLLVFLGILLCSAFSTYAQHVVSERPIKYDNGVMMSDAVTVKFNDKVFDLPPGIRIADISDIPSNFEEFKKYLKDLKKQYGDITLYKKIPSAKWGDIWRRNRITGKLVKMHDMSQLFT